MSWFINNLKYFISTRKQFHRSHDRVKNMAMMGVSLQFAFFVLIFAVCIPVVAAFDAGDALALILGLVLGILGICACLGYYARRKSGV